jgi:putative flippase GtrA
VRIVTWLYFGSLALGLAWFVWVLLAVLVVNVGELSPWPIVIAALGIIASKLVGRFLLTKENYNG